MSETAGGGSPFTEDLARIEQSVRAMLPREPDGTWAARSFGTTLPRECVEGLVRPTRSLVGLGGKRWRPLLLVLCARAVSHSRAAEDAAFALAPLVELAHTASLIHDDIEDASPYRRGQPAVHAAFGVDTAVNAASWLYFEAPLCIERLDAPAELKDALYERYLSALRRMHLGQAMDIAWHRVASRVPSEDEYMMMTRLKTGALAALAAEEGVLCAGGGDALARDAASCAEELGIGFQILDDVINLATGAPGKRRGDDIVEGKKSLIVIDFIERNKDNPSVTGALFACFESASREGIESAAVEHAIGILSDAGSVERARARGAGLIRKGCAGFRALFGEGAESARLIERLFLSMLPA